ncbi:PIG-L family deacetylase [Flavobacterium algicola]|uniref:PIG-L family deacetylase n=1 Tax=Flavobacterium algicola TaxID=556529 RepID=UPI001EFC53E0|nr:PIG-L family deacetylase [Flavobacterium algicola]MCG9793827.1 PIG-L family deacetylase [Flavobacterium algicola]
MHQNRTFSLLIFLLSFQIICAQKPQKPNSAEIYNQIQKLNFLGSVLYIAAHPDDENTKLISYLSIEKKARTAYLSLTRGDGGQNLIGPELREQLGVIRTQELLEARKIDGGQQLFSRANDFGFSKNPKETLEIWDKDKVLSDVVWAIRKFQPDVIINRFDHRTAGNTHGHHSASALLSVESFDLSNDASIYSDQLKYVKPWQVTRQFFNPSYWFYGSQERFDAADKSNFIKFQTGVYYTNLGKSNAEISALSRSSHQSQGFGSTGTRGEEVEYLEPINGKALSSNTDLFDGIDTSWNRVKNGKNIGDLITKIITSYDFTTPSKSIPNLIKAYEMVQSLEDSNWKKIKTEEIKECIINCAGLYLEAVANQPEVIPGQSVQITIEAINRTDAQINLASITTYPNQITTAQSKSLLNNRDLKFNTTITIPETAEFTEPYWLKEEGTLGMYIVNDQEKIGIPDIIRDNKVAFNLTFNGIAIKVERPIVYKYNHPSKGEMYQFLDIVPEVSTRFKENVVLFNNDYSKEIAVVVKSGKENLKGELKLELSKNWISSPQKFNFNLEKSGSEKTFYFKVTPPAKADEIFANSIVLIDGKKFNSEQTIIEYPHIAKQQILQPAVSKFIKLDIKTGSQKIGYIMGAGDAVPASLLQMGYDVTYVDPDEINASNIKSFDVIITGIRAYNTVNSLVNKQQLLFDFVKDGKTMIVQYNTPSLLPGVQLAPLPLSISNNRVTEEDAKITFLAPNHDVLNYPNKITEADFKGWKQEQGLYYPNKYDAAFTPILSSHDTGEQAVDGALLIAPYGKGHYVYTGLSFFRELPEGVSGAFRLMANLISLQNKDSNKDSKTDK